MYTHNLEAVSHGTHLLNEINRYFCEIIIIREVMYSTYYVP